MQTIDSYVVHSRVYTFSERTRRRALRVGVAAAATLAIGAGFAFSGRIGSLRPSPAKFEARIAVEAPVDPQPQDAARIAAFQESVAISHLTADAFTPAPSKAAPEVAFSPAPAKAPEVSVAARQPPALRAPPEHARKILAARLPPTRPVRLEVAAADPVAPPAPAVARIETPVTVREKTPAIAKAATPAAAKEKAPTVLYAELPGVSELRPPLPIPGKPAANSAAKPPVIIQIVRRIEHTPDNVIDFAGAMTGRVLSLGKRVGL